MKIIQSYWSKPYVNSSKNYGWSNNVFHYMSWALSCLKLRQFYSDVELITDDEGFDLLINKLKLPYSVVHKDLNDLENYNPGLWTLGKLHSYSMQTEPFIHVDGDVFIFQKFSDKFESSPLIAQHKEDNYPYNVAFMRTLRENGFFFSEKIAFSGDVIEANAGILGGSDLDFFRCYLKEVNSFMNINCDRINAMIAKHDTAINTIIEQYTFYTLSKYYDRPISFYYDDGVVTDSFCKLIDFSSLPYDNSYIHAIGYYKRCPEIGERIARCLWYEFPEHYSIIMNLNNGGFL